MKIVLVLLGLAALAVAKPSLTEDKSNSLKALEDMLNNLKESKAKETAVKETNTDKNAAAEAKAKAFLTKKFGESKTEAIMKNADVKSFFFGMGGSGSGSGSGESGSGSGDFDFDWEAFFAWLFGYMSDGSGSGSGKGSGYGPQLMFKSNPADVRDKALTEKARKTGMAKIEEVLGSDKSMSGSGSGSGDYYDWFYLCDWLFWDVCEGDEECYDAFWNWGYSGDWSGSASGEWSGSGSGSGSYSGYDNFWSWFSGFGSGDWFKSAAEKKPEVKELLKTLAKVLEEKKR